MFIKLVTRTVKRHAIIIIIIIIIKAMTMATIAIRWVNNFEEPIVSRQGYLIKNMKIIC